MPAWVNTGFGKSCNMGRILGLIEHADLGAICYLGSARLDVMAEIEMDRTVRDSFIS